MANRKISDLTALTAPVTGDLLPIVDISEAAASDKNKKITYGTFLSSVPLGTAAAPSIAFTGDTNTGIYSPGADQLAISTSGTGRITVDGSGNVNIDSNTLYVDAVNNRVGIGTSSVTHALTITTAGTDAIKINTADYGLFDLSNGTSTLRLQNNGSLPRIGTATNHPLVFSPNEVERMRLTTTGALNFVGAGTAGSTQAVSFNGSAPVDSLVIDSSGRLGIGTSGPALALGVKGATGYPATSGTTQTGVLRLSGGTGIYNVLDMGVNQDTDTAWIQATRANNLGASDKLVINPNGGNVGIGTTGPGTLLQVGSGSDSNGVISLFNSWSSSETGKLIFKSNNNFNASLGIAAIYANEPGTVNQNRGNLIFATGQDAAPTEKLRIDSTGVTTITSNASVVPLIIKISTSEVARIDSSGRLLVGGSPDSGGALLQVFGDRIRIGTAKTPASASATGTAGEICWDASYIYVCTATNTWKRTAIATW